MQLKSGGGRNFGRGHNLGRVRCVKFVLTVIFSDINECATDMNNCSANALCINLVSSFGCECNTGFSGDGVTCTGEYSTNYYDLVFLAV